MEFSETHLSSEMQKAIREMGFTQPTAIQEQAIPVALTGADVIGQAQTGTGKTAAFGVPLIERMDPKKKALQGVVLCPTRELAIQVCGELTKLAKYKNGLRLLPVYGGAAIEPQIKALRGGVHVVIGTPGRVMDHMRRNTLNMDKVETVVLDEADEMLDMGFREDMETILEAMPPTRQTMLFSATMPKEILELARTYLKEPATIRIAKKQVLATGIEQFYIETRPAEKAKLLMRLVDTNGFVLTLVFCNTKRRVDELTKTLRAMGYKAEGLHGDMRQKAREDIMQNFRDGYTRILVATDVAARGIDVDDIDAVINYDFPQDIEYYVHRIGRTARAGKTGKAFTFVVGRERYAMRDLMRLTKSRVAPMRPPTDADARKARERHMIDQVAEAAEHAVKYQALAVRMIEELGAEQAIKGLLYLQKR